MTEVQRMILSRVLSQELGKQERWMRKEKEQFGTDGSDRKSLKKEIENFMEKEGIEFREDFYLEEVER